LASIAASSSGFMVLMHAQDYVASSRVLHLWFERSRDNQPTVPEPPSFTHILLTDFCWAGGGSRGSCAAHEAATREYKQLSKGLAERDCRRTRMGQCRFVAHRDLASQTRIDVNGPKLPSATSLRGSIDREFKFKDGASSNGWRHANPTAVALDDRLADGKAHPHPGCFGRE